MQALFERTRKALASARQRYGNVNQVLVSVEELNELSCVLTKYPRFDTHEEAIQSLRNKVLEECGDVFNALDHVQAIFNISDEEIVEAAARKGDRLVRWLQGDTQQVTMTDRVVPDAPCHMCLYDGPDPNALPCASCKAEPGYKGFTPKK